VVAAAIFGGYPAGLVLGIPAFLALRSRMRATVLNCSFVGAAIAAIPWIFILLLPPQSGGALVGGHEVVRDGVLTWWGWIGLLTTIAQAAFAGAFGGAAFWVVAAGGIGDRSITTKDERV
jgi:hypothetical protein